MRVLAVGFNIGNPTALVSAVANGCANLGWQFRTASFANVHLNYEQADFLLLEGFRQEQREVRDKTGKDCLVLELGYIDRAVNERRGVGYHQVGWNKLNWLPNEAPPDRWFAHKLRLQSGGTDEYVLICGQKPRDSQHRLEAEALVDWYQQSIKQVRKLSDLPIVFRPHPDPNWRLEDTFSEYDSVQDSKSVSIEEAVAKAHTVITYNSTSAIAAIIQGTRLYCSHKAMYRPMSMKLLAAHFHEPPYPAEDRIRFLSKVAYAQWTKKELRTGEALRYMVSKNSNLQENQL
jgi:hypothetical protein